MSHLDDNTYYRSQLQERSRIYRDRAEKHSKEWWFWNGVVLACEVNDAVGAQQDKEQSIIWAEAVARMAKGST